MISRRDIWVIAAAIATSVALPVPSMAQNSELPLQKGQVTHEEVSKLTALLQSDAPLHDKAVACKRLAVMGTKEAVPVLASLLSDPQLAHYARYGLEPIPDPSVDAALRTAMAKLNGSLLVGVLNSIGNRKDTKAIDGLQKRLSDRDVAVAAAAAAALGRIGNSRTAKILDKALSNAAPALRASVGDACLACAEELTKQGKQKEALALYDAVRQANVPKHQRLAATRSAILGRQPDGLPLLVEQLKAEDDDFFGVGLRTARDIGGRTVTQTLLAEASHAPARRRALLVLALGDLGDAAALPTILEAAKTGPQNVRVAAIRSLAKLGDVSAVPVLLEAASETDEELARAAQTSLAQIPGKQADAVIGKRLTNAHGSTRRVLIELAGRRRILSTVPTLLKAAEDSDEPIRLAAIGALGETIGVENLSVLTSRVLDVTSRADGEAAQAALTAACVRMADPDACAKKLVACLPKASVSEKGFFLRLLNSVGGTTALQAVSARARNAEDAQMQDLATQVLGEWMSPSAAPVLIDLARTLPNNKYRIRALRGYIRIARQLNLSADERLTMCQEAMHVASRIDEKKLVLDVLRRNPSPESLSLAVSYLDQPGLKGPVSATAVGIAEKIVEPHPAAVAGAMRRVIEAGAGSNISNRAKSLLEQATKKK